MCFRAGSACTEHELIYEKLRVSAAYVLKGGSCMCSRVGDACTEQELIYEKLPEDIAERSVLLMDPMLGSGTSASKAIEVTYR